MPSHVEDFRRGVELACEALRETAAPRVPAQSAKAQPRPLPRCRLGIELLRIHAALERVLRSVVHTENSHNVRI